MKKTESREKFFYIIEDIFLLLMVVFFLGAFVAPALKSGLEKEDRITCQKWQGWIDQGIRQDLFSPDKKMKEMCAQYGISLLPEKPKKN